MPPKSWKINCFWIAFTSASCINFTCLRVAALSPDNPEQSHPPEDVDHKSFQFPRDTRSDKLKSLRTLFSVKQTDSPLPLTAKVGNRFPGLSQADDFAIKNLNNLNNLDNTDTGHLSTRILPTGRQDELSVGELAVVQSPMVQLNFLSTSVNAQNRETQANKLERIKADQQLLIPRLFLGQAELSEGDNGVVPLLSVPNSSPEPLQAPEPPSEAQVQQPSEPPPLDTQPNEAPAPSPQQIEQRLEPQPLSYQQRLERLSEILRNQREKPKREIDIIAIPNPEFSGNTSPPLEEQRPTPPPKPPQPFGFFLAQISYFQTDNLFSSQLDRINDGLIFGGVRFVTAPIPLTQRTFLTGSVEGNLIRYLNESEFNYNQFRVNADIFHRFSRRMYGEFGWSNQQLFYARDANRYTFKAGDKFLHENSWHLSIGRRDPLSSKLMFDSYYELRVSFADPPANRDRIINTLWFAFNYYLQSPLQVGLNYQYYRADFTQRDRDDQYHRLFANLNYRLSDINNLNLQAGYSLGDSTQSDIDFDGWFVNLTYGWELGRF